MRIQQCSVSGGVLKRDQTSNREELEFGSPKQLRILSLECWEVKTAVCRHRVGTGAPASLP
jgi:hypothetical protein